MHTRKALFLDRDGVININHGYVYEVEKVDFIDGIFDLIKRFVSEGYEPVIITNQSGIARGYFTESQFFNVMEYMQSRFSAHGLPVIPVYFCPHHPDFVSDDEAGARCQCRKPMPGMVLEARAQQDFDLGKSVFIGDKLTDLEAAQRAGVGRKLLIDPMQQQQTILSSQAARFTFAQSDVEIVTSLNAIAV